MTHHNNHSNPIYRIALKAREETRQLIKKHPYKIEAYEEDLRCACAIGSYILHKVLKKTGIKTQVIVGKAYEDQIPLGEDPDLDNHCWLELMDGTILDITATQFGEPEPKIFFRHNDKNYRAHNKAHKAIRELNTFPDGQNPLAHKPLLKNAIRAILDGNGTREGL